MHKELISTKETNNMLTQQVDTVKKCAEEYREKNGYLATKLDFQETLFEREYEKRMEQEYKATKATTELNNAKLELSKLPMVKQIFKSKIRGLEKQLVWAMWRFRKKECKITALQKSEAFLKDQTETLLNVNKGHVLLIEKYKRNITERGDKDEEMLKELNVLYTYLNKSTSIYKKGLKKKIVGHLIFVLENSAVNLRTS